MVGAALSPGDRLARHYGSMDARDHRQPWQLGKIHLLRLLIIIDLAVRAQQVA
jgi:hypothetical protein